MNINKKIFSLIQGAENIFLSSHKNCGDATGSVLALAHFLDEIKKPYYVWLPAPVMDSLKFLDGWQKIKEELPALSQFDLFLIVDCGDLKQSGLREELRKGARPDGPGPFSPFALKKPGLKITPIINIDHHITNDNFGHINLIRKDASATAEILYDFFKDNEIKINKQIATCLLTGLLADTGSFANGATTKKALEAASDLLIKGALLPKISSHVNNHFESVNTLKLWGRAFDNLKYNNGYNMAVTVLTQEDFKECNVSEEACEGIANFFNNLKGAAVSLILRETGDGKIKGSLRSTNDFLDVSRFAKMLGGGGHKRAAGFTIDGRLHKDSGSRWRVI